jgi:2-dehydro-3-deoxygluconokinase
MTLSGQGQYVVTLGESMGLLHNPVIGPLSHAVEMRLSTGGAESNVAIALQRLGVHASWIGRVGADSLGERVLRELRAEGVDVHAVIDADAPTGLMIKERRTADASRVWYYRTGSAGSRLQAVDLPVATIEGASLLHVTGITLALSPTAAATVIDAVGIARSRGIPVSFDVNHRSTLWGERDPGPIYRELAELATVVFAGEDEAALLVPGVSGPEALAAAITALGPEQVVIKRGGAGCVALIDGVTYIQAAVPIVPIDTVGAGDAFVAGYLAELLEGREPEVRLGTAVAVGAFACLTAGDWEGLPRRNELALLTASEPVTR